MDLSISILGAAHMHAAGYAAAIDDRPDVGIAAVWDHDTERGQGFANRIGARFEPDLKTAIDEAQAVVVCSENVRHLEILQSVHAAGKPALCEKPIVADKSQIDGLQSLIDGGAKIMTAFPCRYSPAWKAALARVRKGEIGDIQAVCATNRGRCPFDWFTETDKSGGGAMIDHVVHVADLLNVLLEVAPDKVTAMAGSNMYGRIWEDTAMLSLEYANGVFATLDSSWSRPKNYKTWGDVTMNIVGSNGVIELDLFGQAFEVYGQSAYGTAAYGSDLDAALVEDFVRFVRGETEAPISAQDGLKAARVAFEAYDSLQTRVSA